MAHHNYTVADIAQKIGAQVVGDESAQITGLGSLGAAQPGQITHLSSSAYREQLPNTQATAVILSEQDAPQCPVTALVVAQPYLAFAQASQLFAKPLAGTSGIHATAFVDPSSTVDPSASVGANASVGADCTIGPGVSIGAGTVVGARCQLDKGVVLRANVTVCDDVSIGSDSEIHSGAVIGGSGFGFTPGPGGKLQEIAQIGGVVIGSDVSIGANTTIDCGAIDNTVIEDGVKIDNQVQIGHNCRIGAHTLICGCVGIVGSTVVGKHCVLAGDAGIGGDKPIEVCDHVVLSARTHVTASITEPGVYSSGDVFQPHTRWRRNVLRLAKLDELFKRVAKLEKNLNA